MLLRSRLRVFLWLALLLPLFAAAAPAPSSKLNILFLIADDLNCDLGCHGVKEMRTPNIDQLAARGVRFEHAYCQYPLCSPSRSSFLTGRRPNVTGVLFNPQVAGSLSPNFREKIPETVTLPQLFKRNGWFAARVGKLYHYGVPGDIGTSSLDDYASWDQVVNPRGRDREEHDKIFSLQPGQFGAALSWLADEGEDTEHTDGVGADEAIRLLERFKRTSRAFFLAVGFYRPHTPYVAPKKWFELYPTRAITLPQLSADDRSRTPTAAYGSFLANQDTMSDDQRRQAIQAYHGATSFMDAQLGRVVTALDRLGLAQNTLILFTSDHGYHLGDHGLWQKRSLFERATHVPLIIATPDKKNAGRTAAAPVEMLDIYPTLADYAGLIAPEYLDGTTLRPMLDDPGASVRAIAVTQTRLPNNIEGYSARNSRWRYTEWHSVPEGAARGEQLFDEVADPGETRNVIADPDKGATATTLTELKDAIAKVKARK